MTDNRERTGLAIAVLAVLVMAALMALVGWGPNEEVMAAPAAAPEAQDLSAVTILDAGATAYTADHNSSYLVNRYYSEVDVFVSADVSGTLSLAARVQHSPDGATWYLGDRIATLTADSTTYSKVRVPFYGEYVRVAWDLTGTAGSDTYTPTVKVVPRGSCAAVFTEVIDDGTTAYSADHNSDSEVARTGIADIFVSADVSTTANLVPTIQHSPEGGTWVNGLLFTTITADTTNFSMERTTLFGEYLRVFWNMTGTLGYTPTLKITFHEGCGLSAYEELRADGFFEEDAEGDLLRLDGTLTNAAGGSANPFDYSQTAGIMDGSDDLVVWDVNLTNANHTGSSNYVTVIDVAGITADAQATEVAIDIGDGWDYGLTTDSAVSINDDVTVEAEATGGNAGAKNEYIGLPRIKFVDLGAGVNGSTETTAYIDATPTGEWAEVDGGTRVAITADTSIYKATTNSVKIAFTDVYTSEGVDGTITQDDLSANESIGFWIYSDRALTSGDFAVTLDDTDGTDQSYDVPAVSAEIWTWVELNVSACDANCNTTDGIKFLATSQGAATFSTLNVYLDSMYKWDADNEEALGVALVQDGVLNVVTVPTAAATNNTLAIPAEYTDYFTHYESGNDFIVWITDQSANEALAFVAY